MRGDGARVGVEVEHASQPRGDRFAVTLERRRHGHDERAAAVAHAQHASYIIHYYSALVFVAGDGFDSSNGAAAELEQPAPVVWRAIRQAQLECGCVGKHLYDRPISIVDGNRGTG